MIFSAFSFTLPKLLELTLLPRASHVAQWLKNPPAMQETLELLFRSLGQEDSLEEEMATHSSVLAWEIPWTEEPGGLQSIALQEIRLKPLSI